MFDSLEKDRVHALLKAVLYNLWPYLRDHRLARLKGRGQSSLSQGFILNVEFMFVMDMGLKMGSM